MRTLWTVMRKDLLRRVRSPLASIVYLLFPFLFSGLIAVTFGSGDDARAPSFPVVLVDEDGGLVGRLVLGAFDQEQMRSVFAATAGTLAEAERRIARNEVAGAIVIPAGFSQAVLDRRPAQLRVIRNPAQAIGPVAIEEAAEMIAELLDIAAGVFSGPLVQVADLMAGARGQGRRDRWAAFPADARVAEIAADVNRSLRGVQRFALPPSIALRDGDPRVTPDGGDAGAPGAKGGGGARAGASGIQVIFRHVLPGMATFALVFLAMGFVADIPREKERGTLARQLAAPVSARALLAGKLLSAVGMALLVALGMAIIGRVFLNVRGDLPAFLAMSVAFVGAATGLLSLIFGAARSEQQGGTLAAILVMAMSMLGGSWFPLDNLPAFVRNLAPGSLNYWGIRGYHAILVDGAGLTGIVGPLLVLLAVAAAGMLAGSVLLQRRLMRGA